MPSDSNSKRITIVPSALYVIPVHFFKQLLLVNISGSYYDQNVGFYTFGVVNNMNGIRI